MGQQLDAEFWNERWKTDQTGWDMKSVAPITRSYFEKYPNKSDAILIPGCGNAYEAQMLEDLGYRDITIIDISPFLIKKLKEKFKDSKVIKVVETNFFDWEGHYDVIFEQTFFCALSPTLRTDYVDKIHALLKNEGLLVGLLFNRNFEHEGPPFGGEAAEYKQLFQDNFEFLTFENSWDSIPPRADTELFIEFRKQSL